MCIELIIIEEASVEDNNERIGKKYPSVLAAEFECLVSEFQVWKEETNC